MTLRRVLPIELELLAIARAATGALPGPAVHSLLLRATSDDERAALGAGLSPDARAALQQTLGRGVVRAVVRRGGWRRGVFLDEGGRIATGRVWERSPEPLRFTSASFELLRHLTLEPMGDPACPRVEVALLASGDELVLFLLCDLLVALGLPLGGLAAAIGASALAQLAFVDGLTDDDAEAPADPRRVVNALEVPVLFSGLQRELSRHLVRLERVMASLRRPEALAALGRRLERRLEALIDVAGERGRLDLLWFLADACAVLVERERHLALDPLCTLKARQEALTASAAVLRAAARVAALHDALRFVGFVDDGYAEAQALLAAWERVGPALLRAGEVAHRWSTLPLPSRMPT